VRNETGQRTVRETIYWLQDMSAYVETIEKGKELELIDATQYDKLIKGYKEAKTLLEKELENFKNEVNAKYDLELAALPPVVSVSAITEEEN